MEPSQDIAVPRVGAVPVAKDKYVRELDGIRAVAVGIVVSAHYALVPYTPGGFGVTLFFFLSGYLITTLFYAEYHATDTISIPLFYMRRWLRLTPPLIACVVLATVLYPLSRNFVGGSPVPIGTTLAALFYYTNYYDLFSGMDPYKVIPFGICWSLAIEEHFYLAWPLFLRRFLPTPERLCFVVVSLCVAVLLWRISVRHFFLVSTDYTYMATDCRIDSILYGALLRVLFETSWAPRVVSLLRTWWCRGLALVVILAGFLVRDDNFRETARYSLEGIALMPFFTAVLTDDPASLMRKALASPPMVLIGKLSYSIYLFHLPARTPGEVYFGGPYHLGSTISGLVFTFAIAYGLYIFVERPIARLRRRFKTQDDSVRPSMENESIAAEAIATLPGTPPLPL